ncbi:MAG: 2-isopropylmalate synthase [Gammaproteobacteria bacterium]|nr:2-isopropylmalate synthase [Gammaproteobacteria bacterium]
MSSKEKLIIFDTTLRDGEQSPGATMTGEEKLRVALALERLRVDVIEAGFPAASPGDFESVKTIAEAVKESTVCGLARTAFGDIDAAGNALKNANSGRIHTFIATSPIHMEKKLRMSPDEVLERAVKAVERARGHTDNVEFSPEDAGRSEIDFLCRIIEAVIKAGATTINIPDTVGYNVPHQWEARFRTLIERIPNADKAVFSTHCHNDLGLATANSLAAVLGGARQVECTINGLGERAGNAALEEVVMAVRTRPNVFPCETGVDATQISSVSRLVSGVTGFVIQPNKAIVGANAFAHESGIHQDGVLKSADTYEIMRPQDVGLTTNRMTLGKLSGRAGFRDRLSQLGVTFTSEVELNDAFTRFKQLADKKSEIYDEDLQALVTDVGHVAANEKVRLVHLRVCSETGETPEAEVTLLIDGEERRGSARGGGPVDAAYRAIESLVQSGAELMLYSVSNITSGTDSQGEVSVRLADGEAVAKGLGADTDIVAASAKAYINALNHILDPVSRAHPQIDI